MQRPRTAWWFLGAVWFACASCDDLSTPPPTAPDITASALLSDSAAVLSYLAADGVSSLSIASDSMVLMYKGGFTVRLDQRECASPTDTVAVISPVNQLLSNTMCQEPIDTVWSFPGPFPAGSAIILDFGSGVVGATGGMDVLGTYPNWTVKFEDGYDTDIMCPAQSVFSTASVSEELTDETICHCDRVLVSDGGPSAERGFAAA